MSGVTGLLTGNLLAFCGDKRDDIILQYCIAPVYCLCVYDSSFSPELVVSVMYLHYVHASTHTHMHAHTHTHMHAHTSGVKQTNKQYNK